MPLSPPVTRRMVTSWAVAVAVMVCIVLVRSRSRMVVVYDPDEREVSVEMAREWWGEDDAASAEALKLKAAERNEDVDWRLCLLMLWSSSSFCICKEEEEEEEEMVVVAGGISEGIF